MSCLYLYRPPFSGSYFAVLTGEKSHIIALVGLFPDLAMAISNKYLFCVGHLSGNCDNVTTDVVTINRAHCPNHGNG
jgi:hypothetical protein